VSRAVLGAARATRDMAALVDEARGHPHAVARKVPSHFLPILPLVVHYRIAPVFLSYVLYVSYVSYASAARRLRRSKRGNGSQRTRAPPEDQSAGAQARLRASGKGRDEATAEADRRDWTWSQTAVGCSEMD